MACPSASACFAVSAAGRIDRYDGSAWILQSSDVPASAELSGISCDSPTSCMAVGDVGGQTPLAVRWNGTAWKTVAVAPPPPSSFSQLNGVACRSGSDCTAVGRFFSSMVWQSLVEHFNGKSWTLQSSPNPSGSAGSELSRVSCPAPNDCTAVGAVDADQFTHGTLAEHWDGHRWTIQPTPNPPGVESARFDAISCTSSAACVAVGSSFVSDDQESQPISARWNGTGWSLQTGVTLGSTGYARLAAVDCPAAGECLAAGEAQTGLRPTFTLAARWNGTAWSSQPTPNPVGWLGAYLSGVSCVGAGSCAAVGSYTDATGAGVPLVDRYDGAKWSVQSAANPANSSNAGLASVSCPDAADCEAVGAVTDTTPSPATLAERWNGSRWTIQPTPALSRGNFTGLTAVSCVDAGDCTAVGPFTDSSNNEHALAERWNGTSWSRVIVSVPAGGSEPELDGVACPSAGACMAVGFYDDPSGPQLPLAVRWTGSRFSPTEVPAPAGALSAKLISVSCRSATLCTAVGSWIAGDGTGSTLSERWNGASWSIQPSPNPRSATSPSLGGVFCPTSAACVAVGTWRDFARQRRRTLAEGWDGTTWAIEPTRNPGVPDNVLSGVFCTGAHACLAAGYEQRSDGVFVPLLERSS